jgi:hypothetical protein
LHGLMISVEMDLLPNSALPMLSQPRVVRVSWFSVKWEIGAPPLTSRSNDGFS